MAGGEAVPIPLDRSGPHLDLLIESCDGVLLPGSRADVLPEKYGAERDPQTAEADPSRDAVDQLLLKDAYASRKPILGICYGLQTLNVHRAGSLVQHIESQTNHEAGGKVPIAHDVVVDEGSVLAGIVNDGNGKGSKIPVNSSHHQSAAKIGDGLRVSARCPDDGVIEAIEGVDPDHFVLAVQWHPERAVDEDAPSQAIFKAFVRAARTK